jgi:hypothetical protein
MWLSACGALPRFATVGWEEHCTAVHQLRFGKPVSAAATIVATAVDVRLVKAMRTTKREKPDVAASLYPSSRMFL